MEDWYHGTYAETLPLILSQGLKPVLGAGGVHMVLRYGMEVPGVYCSTSL